MSDLVHADIFFFITSISVIVLSLLVAVALFYVVKILRDIQAISAKIRKASDELEQDFESLRSAVKGEGVRVKTIFDLFLEFIIAKFRGGSRRKAKKAQEKEETELAE